RRPRVGRVVGRPGPELGGHARARYRRQLEPSRRRRRYIAGIRYARLRRKSLYAAPDLVSTALIMAEDLPRVMNAFSVDVEDYFHVEALAPVIDRSNWAQLEYRAEASTHRLLDLLSTENVRATFFVLGWVAQRSPGLVRAIHAAGHEVACHGLTHQMVTQQTPEQFRRETIESRDCLQAATGTAVR